MAKLDSSDHFFNVNSLFSLEFFKVKRFRGAHKSKTEKDLDLGSHTLPPEESRTENMGSLPKAVTADSSLNTEDDDDDDFITNEVKRRLKELRKNSFMVLIPEESCPEEEDVEEDSSSSQGREQTVVDGYPWCGFDTLYDKYTERMLFFDKMIAQQLQDAGSRDILNPSPKSASKKLATTLRNLSFKRKDDLQDDVEQLQPRQKEVDPYQNLENAYVAQICLTWEALHCQYMQLSQKISSQPENPTGYNYVAQAFQQFQVLLQRFIENEPFERGSRVEIYVRTRNSLPKLLQAPSFQGLDQKEQVEDDLDAPVLASDLMKAIEESILSFRIFLKMDNKKSNVGLGGQNQNANSLQQLQASVDKKEVKLKELFRKKKGWKKKGWPATQDDVELMFGLVDIKVVWRVLRMVRLSNEQLLWCEEKMSKLYLSENKLHRDGSPVLFPC